MATKTFIFTIGNIRHKLKEHFSQKYRLHKMGKANFGKCIKTCTMKTNIIIIKKNLKMSVSSFTLLRRLSRWDDGRPNSIDFKREEFKTHIRRKLHSINQCVSLLPKN